MPSWTALSTVIIVSSLDRLSLMEMSMGLGNISDIMFLTFYWSVADSTLHSLTNYALLVFMLTLKVILISFSARLVSWDFV